jgi:tape measure domain-containing protein
MGKIVYHSAEAVKELKILVKEFVTLNTTIETTGNSGQLSLSKIESKLNTLNSLNGKTVASLNRLNKTLETNSAANNKVKDSIEGTVDALNKQINKLKSLQSAKAADNNLWLQYELSIRKVKEELNILTSIQSKVHLSGKKLVNTNTNVKVALDGSTLALNDQINKLKVLQSEKATSNKLWLQYELKIKGVKEELNTLTRVQSKVYLSTKKLSNANSKATVTIAGTVDALNKEINGLRKLQSAKAADNRSWLQYELRIKAVQNKLSSLRATQSGVYLSTKKQTAATTQNTVANKVNTKSIQVKTTALRALRNTFGLFIGFHFLKEVVLSIFEMTKNFDSLRFSMEKIVDTSFDLASSQRFLIRISEDYGVELLATSQRYVKFLAAAKQSNLSLNDTEIIFKSVTKAASVLGLKTLELTGVYLALEQMLSKGKVTTEELRRQLGERLPGAMGIMAAALDVTIPKLDEMLRKGEVLSADALPKFAKALEVAFSITNVKKIDNLNAAQNRLANTWQMWVEDISKGENGLTQFFKSAINGLNGLIKALANATASDAFKLQALTIDKTVEAEIQLRDDALADLEKNGEKVINLTKSLQDKQYEILTASTTKRLDLINKTETEKDLILNEELRLIIVNQTKQEEAIQASEKRIAKSRVARALENYQDNKADYERDLKLIKDSEPIIAAAAEKAMLRGRARAAGGPAVQLSKQDKNEEAKIKLLKTEVKAVKQVIDARRLALATTEAYFDVYRKKIQESNVNTPEGTVTGSGLKDLKNIRDLQAEIDIEILKSTINSHKLQIDSLETTNQERKDLILDLFNYEKRIAEIEKDDIIKLSKDKYDEEIEQLNKYLSESKITIIQYNDQKKALQKQFDQEEELAELDFQKKIKESKLKNGKEILKIVEAENKSEIDLIKDKYNLEIISLNNVYTEKVKAANKEKNLSIRSKILAKAWEELEIGKKDVAIRMANEIIDLRIAMLEAELAILNQSDENKAKIIQQINALKAARKKINPGKEDVVSWQSWAEKIAEVINEVGELVDAIYARRIENIEAEIRAEEVKYDRLIKLAEDDNSRKKALEQERFETIQKLEAERLKQEQKAAVARKAFAAAEIVVNTAVSISKVLYNPFLVAMVAALGAVQLATVLAAPIPQYKDGIESVPENQVAMINDGGKKEYVERNGQILSTNTKNAIVNLKKNDTVHKDYEAATKSSSYSIITKGEIIKQNEFDKLSKTIKSSIKDGFSTAKISNVLKLNNNSSNSYLKQKARF